MDAKTTRLAVLKALLKSPATCKLVGLALTLYGLSYGETIADLLGELAGTLWGVDSMGHLKVP